MVVSRVVLGMLLAALLSCATTSGEDMRKAQAHYKLGVSHLHGGNVQPAYVEFQTALALDPNNKEIRSALGTVYMRLQDLKAAEEQFQASVRIDPKYSDAHNNLCYVYYQAKRWDSAVASCKKALENPLYITPEKAYYSLGRIYYRLGKYDDAIAAYDNALLRMPGLHLAYYGLALSYNAKRQYGKAAEAMTQALLADPAIRGDIDKAEKEFSSKVESGSDEAADFKDYLEMLKY